MTPIEPPVAMTQGAYIRRQVNAVVAGLLMASCAWVWLYVADTAAWDARLAGEYASTTRARNALLDRCAVPVDGQVVGTRKAGRPVCVLVDNLKLPKLPKGK